MCQDCGCGDVNLVPLDVQQRILARNDDVAAHNRAHFQERGIFSVNLMGSPGSGKTAVLEATAWQTLEVVEAINSDADLVSAAAAASRVQPDASAPPALIGRDRHI